jgi:DNA-binding NarL/FixJ family response regulator
MAGQVRVLVADDNELLRMGLVSLLDAQDGIVVVAQAEDGAVAVELAAEHRPDVALLDVRMPNLDGVEAAARMPEGTRVIMLTYTDEPAVISRALSGGALGYLVHGSHSPGEIVQAVLSASHGMAVLGPAATAVMLSRRIDGAVQDTDSGAPAGPGPTAPSMGLTAREVEIMDLIADGRDNRQIAGECFLAEKTVKNHVNRIFAKLSVRTRAEAVSLWLRREQLGPGPGVAPGPGAHDIGSGRA